MVGPKPSNRKDSGRKKASALKSKASPKPAKNSARPKASAEKKAVKAPAPSARPKAKSGSAKKTEKTSSTKASSAEKTKAKGVKERKGTATSPKTTERSAKNNVQAGKATKPGLTPFLKKQRERLLALKDMLLDSMNGVAKDSLRARAEGSEANAFGMHQADAGSDAYDRDFALTLLSREQDSLYEIDEALKRIELGTYGICEMSGKPIPHARLEALPFTRYTVECQAELEKRNRFRNVRQPMTSLFGPNEETEEESEEEISEPKE